MEVLELYSGLMEKTVAVKKLCEAKTQGHQEFIAEMETLEKVKHQNLVPLLGYCSFDEENLLVYEYMVNGSLDLWLRNRTGALEVLDWDKRLNIATGAARGLAFLHHGFIPHIIHRDKSKGKSIFDTYFAGVAFLERGSAVSNGVAWACIFVQYT
jgi:serine/threonine protein kinase